MIVDATTALAAQPVSAAELAKAIARLETAFWERLSSSHGRAEALGEFETAGGGFQNLFARAAAYQAVTAEDVARVAKSYLATGRALDRRRAPEGRGADVIGALLSATLAVGGAAPRSPGPAASAGAAERRAGPAGSVLIVESNRTVPLVHVVVASRSGAAADPRHREGLTNLAAEMGPAWRGRQVARGRRRGAGRAGRDAGRARRCPTRRASRARC